MHRENEKKSFQSLFLLPRLLLLAVVAMNTVATVLRLAFTQRNKGTNYASVDIRGRSRSGGLKGLLVALEFLR